MFLVGAEAFACLKWRDAQQSLMGWFLLTSLWSAVCGVGFTVSRWWIAVRGGARENGAGKGAV